MAINEATLNQLLGQAVVDYGGTYQTVLAVIGEKLGCTRPWPTPSR
jgi:hypothetical protein